MRILVTGANGQLGNEMQVLSKENPQHVYFFTDVQELDICDEQAINRFVTDNEIDIIVNCAAYTAVDKAEDNPELCDKLNHIAPGIWPGPLKAGMLPLSRYLPIMSSTELPMSLIRKRNPLVQTLYMALRSWLVSRL